MKLPVMICIALLIHQPLISLSNGINRFGIQNSIVDSSDTVVFDIANSTISGNTIEIPVYIISDDTINALDFSFKFDETKYHYDTIISLMPYLQPTSFYNSSDSTVRFTSYSLHNYDKNIALVKIRMTMLGANIQDGDMYSMDAYLNGDPCSYYFTSALTAGIDSGNNQNQIMHIELRWKMLHLLSVEKGHLKIFDSNGKEQLAREITDDDVFIDLHLLSDGFYIVDFVSENGNYTCKKVFVR
jgi:hypothetical protein